MSRLLFQGVEGIADHSASLRGSSSGHDPERSLAPVSSGASDLASETSATADLPQTIPAASTAAHCAVSKVLFWNLSSRDRAGHVRVNEEQERAATTRKQKRTDFYLQRLEPNVSIRY